jgi:predicted DNA-binding protein (UPF0251 family)
VTNEEWQRVESVIELVVSRARRRYPLAADDVAQEARIAAWLRLRDEPTCPPGFVRQAAKWGVAQAMMPKYRRQKIQAPTFESFEDQTGVQPPEPVGRLPERIAVDVQILEAVARTGSGEAAATRLGIAHCTLKKQLAKSKSRVTEWLDSGRVLVNV